MTNHLLLRQVWISAALVAAVSIHSARADVVSFGACYHEPTNSHRCAKNSTYCFEGEDWFRPDELSKGVVGRTECGCQDIHTGNCSPSHGQRGVCRSDEAACPDGTERFSDRMYFYNDGAICQCHGKTGHDYSKHAIEFRATTYGACTAGGGLSERRCVMNSWSCEAGETWIHPDQLQGGDCTCSEVQVGACFHQLGSTCSVDADSCTPSETFISPFQAASRGLNCRLCHSSDLNAAEEESRNDLAMGQQQEQTTTTNIGEKSSSSTVTVSWIVMGLLIGAVVFFFATTVYFGMSSRVKRKKLENEKTLSIGTHDSAIHSEPQIIVS